MEKIKKTIAKKTAQLLKSLLILDANSTSCYIVYQPKAPKELSKFRKQK